MKRKRKGMRGREQKNVPVVKIKSVKEREKEAFLNPSHGEINSKCLKKNMSFLGK